MKSFLLKDNEKELLAKCEEFRPALLILASEIPNLPALVGAVTQKCAALILMASYEDPVALPYTSIELKRICVFGILSRPCAVKLFVEVIGKNCSYLCDKNGDLDGI